MEMMITICLGYGIQKINGRWFIVKVNETRPEMRIVMLVSRENEEKIDRLLAGHSCYADILLAIETLVEKMA